MLMQLLCHPRATPLVVVSHQDGVFVVKDLAEEEEEKGVICLTADTVANVVGKICKAYLEEQWRDKGD